MIIKRVGLLLLVFFCGCVSPAGFMRPPKFDPTLSWQVIKTGHFHIYFHQGETESAQKAARIAEEIYTVLVSRIGWIPEGPTHLVISDQADIVNGMATTFPGNTIYINLAPASSFPLTIPARFEDWLRSVITHEYVHILQLDMNTGFPAMLRTLFGRYPLPFGIFNGPFPNELQPVWLIEGLAVRDETIVGGDDRATGAGTEMLLRMAILEDRFPTLDQAAGQLDSWPNGQVSYLFGARFLEYIRQQFGEDAIKNLNWNYSGKLFPLWVDNNAWQTLGVSYVTLWNQWKMELTEKYHAQRGALEKSGLSFTQPLMQRGDENLGPKIRTGGDIVYTSINPREYPALRILHPNGEDQFLIRRNMGWSSSWSPDGSQLAFSQLEIVRNYAQYSDLYLYDFKSKKVKRLTEGARLRDPDFHPSGTSLVAIEGQLGQDRLVIYDLNTGMIERIDTALLMSNPRWSPDGKQIVMSGWKDGNQDIYLFDIHSKQLKPLWVDKALDLTPTWATDGHYIIFSSDRTGIFNLFSYQIETNMLFQITNLLGGAFMPEVQHDHKIVFSYYSAKGFDLHTLGWDMTTWKKVEPEIKETPPQQKPETDALPVKPYAPWATLRPRYWAPTALGYSSINGTTLGITTGGRDVLGQHEFDLGVLKKDRDFTYSLDYYNDVYYPTIHLGLFDETRTAYYDTENPQNRLPDYRERRKGLNINVTFNRLLFQSQSAISIGYQAEQASTFFTQTGRNYDNGSLNGIGLVWLFNSTKYYPFSISPEDGYFARFGYERYDRHLGSDWNENRYFATLNQYDTLYKSNHVMALELSGAVVTGDRGAIYVLGEQNDFLLRGYPNDFLSGERVAVGTASYRFPIQNIERGFRTWPFFFSRLHGAVFFEAGNAADQKKSFAHFRKGVGAELKLNMTFAYYVPIQFIAGFAKGLDEGGVNQSYFEIQGGY